MFNFLKGGKRLCSKRLSKTRGLPGAGCILIFEASGSHAIIGTIQPSVQQPIKLGGGRNTEIATVVAGLAKFNNLEKTNAIHGSYYNCPGIDPL